MKELDHLEELLKSGDATPGFFISVRKADLKIVCAELRKRIAPPAPVGSRFEDDKKLIQRITNHAQNLNSIEEGILETSQEFIEDGRELTEKMRAVMKRVDETKVR